MSDGCSKTEVTIIELPDLPSSIPYAFDDGSLASVMKISRKALWAGIKTNADGHSIRAHYIIPKRGGRVRHVYEPQPYISRIQNRILTHVIGPIHAQLGEHVTAYRTGVNFLDAARDLHFPPCPICAAHPDSIAPPKHPCYRQGLYLHMDLSDFFHSVRKSHVRNTFKHWGYSHDVASYLAGLLTIPLPHQYGGPKSPRQASRTPQGFPASGAVCNLVADYYIDQHIIRKLDNFTKYYKIPEEYKLRYSRYADDLSIFCGYSLARYKVNKIIHAINEIVTKALWKVNKSKTQINYGTHGKKLLGMSFARHSNIPKEQYRFLRAVVHKYGTYSSTPDLLNAVSDSQFAAKLAGKLEWFDQLNPYKTDKLRLDNPMAMYRISS